MTRRPAHGCRRWVLVVAVATSAGATASAAPPPPAPLPVSSAAPSIENEPVRFGPAAAAARPAAAGRTTATDAAADLSHVVVGLGIVLALIFGLRWVARKFALVPNAGLSGRSVRVLSRTMLAPKQQVILLQVGRRIIVVGDSGAAGMHRLAEIADPDEVAALVGNANSADATAAPAKSFVSLFRRASEPYDARPDADPPAAGETDFDQAGDVVSLLDKVRGMRQQFER